MRPVGGRHKMPPNPPLASYKVPSPEGTKAQICPYIVAPRWDEPMPDDVIFLWLLRPLPMWMTFLLGAAPAMIARVRRRPIATWCLYGFGCALVAWPLIAVPIMHALLLHPRTPSRDDRERRRRADALALIAEPGLRSYPSHIAE